MKFFRRKSKDTGDISIIFADGSRIDYPDDGRVSRALFIPGFNVYKIDFSNGKSSVYPLSNIAVITQEKNG